MSTSYILNLVVNHQCRISAMILTVLPIIIMCALSIVPNACIPIRDARTKTKLLTYYSKTTDNQRTFSYDLDDGQRRSETVTIVDVDHPVGEQKNGISVQGSFSFNGSDGKLYLVEFLADKNGFQPKIMILEPKPMIGISVIDEDSLLNGQVLKSLVG